MRALAVLDLGHQFAMVADAGGKLLGVVTDGNVRRGLLNGKGLDAPVAEIMNSQPFVVGEDATAQGVLALMQEHDFSHIPVVDASGRLVWVWARKELSASTLLQNPVVLMAGGLGTRLGELTRDCPKPMLPVGGRPILEIVLQNLRDSGFYNFFIAVNYQAEKIKNYFADGSKLGVKINYLHEDKRMGTAGALSLLPARPSLPALVMNGDILTRLNPRLLLQHHNNARAIATMVVIDHKVQVPYGVVDSLPDGELSAIREKPTVNFPVSAGINVLSPEAFAYIPADTFFDMPDLFRALLNAGKAPQVYHSDDYWLDIGRADDYAKAGTDFTDVFAENRRI